jgi:4'-phosphopantetheinyl transferase
MTNSNGDGSPKWPQTTFEEPLSVAMTAPLIWIIDLRQSRQRADENYALLDQRERTRAHGVPRPDIRRRFINAHGSTRRLLGNYLGRPPSCLTFESGTYGKPYVANEDVHFSLSHTGDLALLAISRYGPLGIDVERIRGAKNDVAMISPLFSRVERETLSTASDPISTFFTIWTRKEAYLKATGRGLSRSLQSFTVNHQLPARLLEDQDDSQAPDTWALAHLNPVPGYIGAVCSPSICGTTGAIECRLESETIVSDAQVARGTPGR